MGRCLIKIKDLYFEWSTVVDAPVTYGMTLDELRARVKEERGNEGLRELPERLERVEEYGSSFQIKTTLEELISTNRAGNNEEKISLNDIYKRYTNQKAEPCKTI
jgi:hypothetical protein